MKLSNKEWIYSPSDLIAYVESPLLAWLRRYDAEFPGRIPKNKKDEVLEMVARKGMDHEKNYLQSLKEADKSVVEIRSDDGAEEKTLQALKAGSPIVYQAALRMKGFRGTADFLIKVEKSSQLGGHSYEPVDTKLSLKPKPYFLIQLCCYAEMLESICGHLPANIHIVLGDQTMRSYKALDYFFYYKQVKQSFLEQMHAFDPELMPEPSGNENFGEWQEYVDNWLEDQDHLIRVANMRLSQIKNLKKKGITTMQALANTQLLSIPGMDPYVFMKLKKQASLQIASEPREKPLYEVIPPKDGEMTRQGLASLPPLSDLDVFFDMEGYPFANEGLEYLFGVVYIENNEQKFIDFWAHDREQEKKAFEQFIDWLFARFKKDNNLHVYHYANYEVSALRRLSQRHATREEIVDHMLRCGVFVDLYQIVRHSLIVGEPRYSIKNIENIYMGKRLDEIKSAFDSVLYYEHWIEGKDGETWQTSKLLKDIRDYNMVDCNSTLLLTNWLRTLQKEHGVKFVRAEREVEQIQNEITLTPEEELSQDMLANIPDDIRGDNEKERVWKLLAHFLVFHKRADKPEWWEFFDRHEKTDEELAEDLECLSDLSLINKRSSVCALYKYDPSQDTKLKEGSRCQIAGWVNSKVSVTVDEIDTDAGCIVLKFGGLADPIPEKLSIIPNPFLDKKSLIASINSTVSEYCKTRKLRPALSDFLYRKSPALIVKADGPLLSQKNEVSEELKELVSNLNETTLCVQGPPGTGKTYISSLVILDLLKKGKKVGITSNSHHAIANLMKHVADRATENGFSFKGLKVGKKATGDIASYKFFDMGEPKDYDNRASRYSLVGGTAWLFSKPSVENHFDYLFVDEAGQVSVANLIAMSRSAKNIILIGDQMQLSQPIRGSHPEESGLSCLDYYLQEHHTIPAEQGVFLSSTRRLNPDICSAISETIYDGRLHAHPITKKRSLVLKENPRVISKNGGILYVSVDHKDNTQGSDEEADVVINIVDDLVGAEFTDEDGKKKLLTIADILIVSPYNLQVIKLEKALGDKARIGTVDKFQGQEAPVVIISMAASSGHLSTRGTEFLFNKNRLNVAITRAQCLAIIVGSPNLKRTVCTNIADMERVNMFCRLIEA